MVILDELCSGTNPSEGEEIFELVVKMLTRLKPQAFITTHFLAFAARLEKERKIADLRFLQAELGPDERLTYHQVRVAVVDLRAQRVLLRARKRVDPNWLAESTRSTFATAVDGCALAFDVRAALAR
jgi:DNA mismatch repair protein MutS2